MVSLNFSNFAEVINQPFNFTIMKPDIKTQNLWEYIARIQEEVSKEVLEQTTDDEYSVCLQAILDYMYELRNMNTDRIWHFNSMNIKYVKLINEALKKHNIFISSQYIHISFG